MNINILFSLGNKLCSEALKELMRKYGCKYTIGVSFPSNGSFSKTCEAYDVIVTDYQTLSKIPREWFENSKVIIMENGLEKETITSLFVTENIMGVVSAESDVDLLIKAIEAVHDGEIWINNKIIKSLLNKSMKRNLKDSSKLTEREHAILKGLKAGYRNKEIASMLSISEQTVKSHLGRIFRKMNVSGRAELISKLLEYIYYLDSILLHNAETDMDHAFAIFLKIIMRDNLSDC